MFLVEFTPKWEQYQRDPKRHFLARKHIMTYISLKSVHFYGDRVHAINSDSQCFLMVRTTQKIGICTSWFIEPTYVCIPNGISISSADFTYTAATAPNAFQWGGQPLKSVLLGGPGPPFNTWLFEPTRLRHKRHLDRFSRLRWAHERDQEQQTDKHTQTGHATPSVAVGRYRCDAPKSESCASPPTDETKFRLKPGLNCLIWNLSYWTHRSSKMYKL